MKLHPISVLMFLLAIALYIGANITLSQWQFLFSAILFSCLLVGILTPFFKFKNLIVSKNIPLKLYVGKKTAIHISLENCSKRNKRFINVLDNTLLISNQKSVIQKILEFLFKSNSLITDQIYFIKRIPPESKVSFQYDYTPATRGVVFLGKTELMDSSPIGLFTKTKSFSHNQTVVVYPKIINIRAGWLRRITHKTTLNHFSKTYTPSSMASNTRNLREYVPGDAFRYIHWSTSAKRNCLMVREFEIETQNLVIIVLDSINHYKDSLFYELAVITTASLLNTCHKNNIKTRFVTQKKAYKGYTEYRDDNWFSQLEVLARVQQVKEERILSYVDSINIKNQGFNTKIVLISPNYASSKLRNIVNITISPERDQNADYTISSEKDLRFI